MWSFELEQTEGYSIAFNTPKRGAVPLPPRSLLTLWTQPTIAFAKFDFYGSSIQVFLVQAENGLWQHIKKIAYEKSIAF